MVTTGTETTHGLTYSVATATEVTAWQSIDAVYLCCLTHGACVKVTGLQSLLTTTMSRRWLQHCHLSTWPAACAGPESSSFGRDVSGGHLHHLLQYALIVLHLASRWDHLGVMVKCAWYSLWWHKFPSWR